MGIIVSITAFDSNLSLKYSMQWPNGRLQDFQFPPKVTSNSMTGDFKQGDRNIAVYPTYTYAGPNERFFNVEVNYIVTGQVWTARYIKDQVKNFREYYFRIPEPANKLKSAIWCKLSDIGYDKPTTFFMRGLNIKQSATMVNDRSDPDNEFYYPLRTDITFELVIWWNVLQVGANAPPDDGLDTLPIEGIKGETIVGWF